MPPTAEAVERLRQIQLQYFASTHESGAKARRIYEDAYGACMKEASDIVTDTAERQTKAYARYVEALGKIWEDDAGQKAVAEAYADCEDVFAELGGTKPDQLRDLEDEYGRWLQELGSRADGGAAVDAQADFANRLAERLDRGDAHERAAAATRQFIDELQTLQTQARERAERALTDYQGELGASWQEASGDTRMAAAVERFRGEVQKAWTELASSDQEAAREAAAAWRERSDT